MTEEINIKEKSKATRVVVRPFYTSVTQIVTIQIPAPLLMKIDELIQKGYFQNRSDAIREAVRRLVIEYERTRYNLVVGYR
jgi:metal-responsive CopG/Arc/MetJ family transcriptional regulator